MGLAAPPTSLKPVIDVLPDSVYDNPTWRGMAYFWRDTAMYVALLALLVFVTNVAEVLALEVAMGLVVSGLFVVGHDAAHGALFSSKRRNSTVAHLAMLPSFHVYEGWVLGHNRVHHPYTVRQGYDFVWHPTTPEQFAEFGWWRKLVHRFEWSWAGAGAYYAHQVWWKKMMTGPNPARWVKAIRRDRWIVTAFIAGMLALFTLIGLAQGDSVAGVVWLDVRTVLLPFVAFSYLIGTVVHTHHIAPDIRWWKKAEWNKFKAQMEGTTVLRVPQGRQLLPALDHGARPPPRRHAHPDVPPRGGGGRHRGRLPGHGHRQAAAPRRLRRQRPGVQALRLRRRTLDDLRRRSPEPGRSRRLRPERRRRLTAGG